jgi:hypothetical protein
VKNGTFQILLKPDGQQNCHGSNMYAKPDYHPEKNYYANKNTQAKDLERV